MTSPSILNLGVDQCNSGAVFQVTAGSSSSVLQAEDPESPANVAAIERIVSDEPAYRNRGCLELEKGADKSPIRALSSVSVWGGIRGHRVSEYFTSPGLVAFYCDHVPERTAAVFSTAHVRQDDRVFTGGLSGGLECLYGFLSIHAPRRIPVCPFRHQHKDQVSDIDSPRIAAGRLVGTANSGPRRLDSTG